MSEHDLEELTDRELECEESCVEPEVTILEIEGDLAREAAMLSIRFLRAGLLRKLVAPRGARIRDMDVLTLIGIDLDPQDFDDSDALKEALSRAMQTQLETLSREPTELGQRIDRNLAEIGHLLSIPTSGLTLLRAALVSHQASAMQDLWNFTEYMNSEDLIELTVRALNLPKAEVRRLVSADSPLRRTGLLLPKETRANPLLAGGMPLLPMEPRVAEVLLGETVNPDVLLRAVARISAPPKLSLADFPHIEKQVSTALRFLVAADRDALAGANVLIHGDPGVGKTELARALAAAAGLILHEVPTEDREGDPIEHQQRLAAFWTCQRLLQGVRGRAILFDEIEDVFPADAPVFGHRRGLQRVIPKGHVNEMLQSTPVPTIWVSNAVDQMDPAYLRRFALILEVPQLPQRHREGLVRQVLEGVALPAGTIEDLAAIPELAPGLLESTARVLRLVADTDSASNLRRLKSMVRDTLSAMGRQANWPVRAAGPGYHLDWLNPSRPLEPLIEGLARVGRGRICLYGPPGTGKTAFAHHLAHVLGRPLVCKRASDLHSKWVGETEQRIAAMFEQAARDGAVLLLDEADSFLAARQAMQTHWQVTQVNEMLTRMETFDGLFVASTNLVETLDDASLRRFDFKVRFDPPRPPQRLAMVLAAHARLTGSEPPGDVVQSLRSAIDRLHELTPGDIANACRQCEIMGQRPELPEWVELLQREVEAKRRDQRAPIGFVH